MLCYDALKLVRLLAQFFVLKLDGVNYYCLYPAPKSHVFCSFRITPCSRWEIFIRKLYLVQGFRNEKCKRFSGVCEATLSWFPFKEIEKTKRTISFNITTRNWALQCNAIIDK